MFYMPYSFWVVVQIITIMLLKSLQGLIIIGPLHALKNKKRNKDQRVGEKAVIIRLYVELN